MNIPNYKILKEIGAGGMGTVYLAEHTLIKRKVAIKSLKQDLIKNEQLRERFKKEARLKKKVKIHGSGLGVNGFPFTAKREKLKSTSIFNQIIGMDININKRNVFTIENHNSIYRIFYFYLIILLLPVITLLSRGPNIIYIFSSYMISTISAITMILLFILLLI